MIWTVLDEKSPRLRELKKKFEEIKALRSTPTAKHQPQTTTTATTTVTKRTNSESGPATAHAAVAVKPKQSAVTMRKPSKPTSRPASDDSVSRVSSGSEDSFSLVGEL